MISETWQKRASSAVRELTKASTNCILNKS